MKITIKCDTGKKIYDEIKGESVENIYFKRVTHNNASNHKLVRMHEIGIRIPQKK